MTVTDALGLDVVRRAGVTMRTRDGVALVADLWHPRDAGPWPALLVRTAYGRAVASGVTAPHPAVLARAGYLVVSQDVRGRGDSGGGFDPFVHEADDGEDAIAWIATLDECDGRVGMYGFSYQGTVQLLAAARRPRALRAIAPAMCSSDPADGFLHAGGIFRLGFAVSWATQLGGAGGFFGDTLPHVLAQRCAAGRVSSWAFWDAWEEGRCGPAADVAAIDVPALFTIGWYDSFAGAGARDIASFTAPARMLGAPWWHLPWSPDANVATDAHLAFFDEHVAGRAPTSPPASVRSLPVGGDWVALRSWPPPGVRRRFGIAGSGRAASRWGDGRLVDGAGSGPPDIAVHQPFVPVPAVGGAYAPALGIVGAADQGAVQDRTDVLCYTSAPFPDGIELAGSPSAWLDVTSDAPTVDTCATLCTVDPDGTAHNLTSGAARAGNGRRVQFGPVHALVPAGYRLRVAVAASAYPELAPNRSAGWAQVTWALNHTSHLELPVFT